MTQASNSVDLRAVKPVGTLSPAPGKSSRDVVPGKRALAASLIDGARNGRLQRRGLVTILQKLGADTAAPCPPVKPAEPMARTRPARRSPDPLETDEFDPLPDWGAATSRAAEPRPSQVSTAEAAGDIKGQLVPANREPEASSGSDRRAHPRRRGDCTVSVCRKPNHPIDLPQSSWLLHSRKVSGRLIDVSMSGLAFQLAQELEVQSGVLLQVAHRQLDRSVTTSGRVLRCSPTDDGEWMVVCRLDSHLTFDEVHRISNYLFSSTIV